MVPALCFQLSEREPEPASVCTSKPLLLVSDAVVHERSAAAQSRAAEKTVDSTGNASLLALRLSAKMSVLRLEDLFYVTVGGKSKW